MVDHTVLKPEAGAREIETLCAEAIECGFTAVCVNSLWVPLASKLLADEPDIDVCSVVGFPLGAMQPAGLQAETSQAVGDGATEIDMVLAVGPLQAGDRTAGKLIEAVVTAAEDQAIVKVILETALLSDDEIVRACELAVSAGAKFVKTSTGFNNAGGATFSAVELMRATVGPSIGVKASGGIRTLDDVHKMIAAGASRLGMSAGANVYRQLPQ